MPNSIGKSVCDKLFNWKDYYLLEAESQRRKCRFCSCMWCEGRLDLNAAHDDDDKNMHKDSQFSSQSTRNGRKKKKKTTKRNALQTSIRYDEKCIDAAHAHCAPERNTKYLIRKYLFLSIRFEFSRYSICNPHFSRCFGNWSRAFAAIRTIRVLHFGLDWCVVHSISLHFYCSCAGTFLRTDIAK